MGKKGSWFSVITRVFVHNSKEKPVNEFESHYSKETRKKDRGQRHGETKSFIPMFREPSSIEEILGEIDEQKLLIRPLTLFEPPKIPPLLTPNTVSPKATSTRVTSPTAASPKATSTRVTSPKAASTRAAFIREASPKVSSQQFMSPKVFSSRDVNRHKEVISYRSEPTLRYQHLSATKIQSAYRGYTARRSFRALRGLVRLQGVVRGQNVKWQTGNAMKMMQLLVRVQTQIQSRRIHMLKNQALKRQGYHFDKELESTLGKWVISQSEVGDLEDWDDSTLTKEERDARMQKRMEAVFKRERAMAYTYSHQTSKSNPKSAQPSVYDLPPDGFPWWRNWTQRQLPDPPVTQSITTLNNLTPPRRTPGPKPTPQPPSSYKSPHRTTFDYYGSTTPTSTRSMTPLKLKHFMPTPPRHSSSNIKTKPSVVGFKDDDSLTSCPPFSVPNYMTPTVSAKAKARSTSNPKERFPGTPGHDSRRRFSFPLTPNIGPFKWNKGSPKKDPGSKNVQSFEFPGDFSIDSAISTSSAVRRKPFNRFV